MAKTTLTWTDDAPAALAPFRKDLQHAQWKLRQAKVRVYHSEGRRQQAADVVWWAKYYHPLDSGRQVLAYAERQRDEARAEEAEAREKWRQAKAEAKAALERLRAAKARL